MRLILLKMKMYVNSNSSSQWFDCIWLCVSTCNNNVSMTTLILTFTFTPPTSHLWADHAHPGLELALHCKILLQLQNISEVYINCVCGSQWFCLVYHVSNVSSSVVVLQKMLQLLQMLQMMLLQISELQWHQWCKWQVRCRAEESLLVDAFMN